MAFFVRGPKMALDWRTYDLPSGIRVNIAREQWTKIATPAIDNPNSELHGKPDMRDVEFFKAKDFEVVEAEVAPDRSPVKFPNDKKAAPAAKAEAKEDKHEKKK